MNLSPDNLNYFAVFFWGILASFTPCVYPLIPVIIGFIGIKAGDSKIRGFFLSLVYVAGIAVTYSILGLAASLTGKIFGAISSNPVTQILVGIIIILFGISMFGLFIVPVPNFTKLPNLKNKGYASGFILGLASGLIISPCLSPVLGAVLAYLATKKNLFYGTTLLFTFALGMGLILILAGTFSGILMNLPKPGKWLVYVKKISALILIGIGSYFIFSGITGLT